MPILLFPLSIFSIYFILQIKPYFKLIEHAFYFTNALDSQTPSRCVCMLWLLCGDTCLLSF